MSVARRRREHTDSAEYSDASYEEDNQINSADDDDGDSEYDSAEQSGSDLSERESGDGQAAPGSQKGEKVDDDEDRRNPQYIPKRGTFYEHDDRTAPGEEEVGVTENNDGSVKPTVIGGEVTKIAQREKSSSAGIPGSGPEKKQRQSRANAADKWTHDKFNENDQAPKSSEELVSIYGYDIRAEDGPPRAFRRRKYGRGPNKYTRNWEDEKAYGTKNTPNKTRVPPQVTNGEEFPSLQNSSQRSKGDRRRNGTTPIPKKTIEVVSASKRQDVDKNANNTPHSGGGDHVPTSNHVVADKVTVPKQRTAGTGRVGIVPTGPLRRPYAEAKESPLSNTPKDTPSPLQKISVPPSAGLPSASLGGTTVQEKKAGSAKKPTVSNAPPRNQQLVAQQLPSVVSSPQQSQQISSASNNVNNNSILNARASPPQQMSAAQTQQSAQSAEMGAGRGKRYSSIRQRPMPDQYQPVQYSSDFQQTQQTQQPSVNQQSMGSLPHRQTPPPTLQQSQQQILVQQNQQLLQTQQMQQQLHQKTPPPQLHQSAMHQTNVSQIIQPTQGLNQTNPNMMQSSQLHQTTQLHQMQQIHQASPTLHQSSSSVHQTNAGMMQTNPQMLQPSSSIHQSSPQMLQTTPSLHPSNTTMIQGQQLHQPSAPLHQPSAPLHQPSPTLHQASPTLHQNNAQSILQTNPTMHQVSPPLQTQMGRQASGPAVNTMPIRQVQRTHQQMPLHNMPAPTHIPQQSLVATQSYPPQPMMPQTQYIQNNNSGMYSHNIPPQVYQTPQGYVAPPPPMPYHHQPTPPYQTGRSVYREPSGITFYSPQEQKGSSTLPPTRRPTNAIPIVSPPSKRDKLSDAAAAQKDNIDHIVDNMFVPRQSRNVPPRTSDASKTAEPVASQPEPMPEEKSKDGSGDKSSKESNYDPVCAMPVRTEEALDKLALEESEDRMNVESLASQVDEKLNIESPENNIVKDDEEEVLYECEPQDAEATIVDSSNYDSTQSEIEDIPIEPVATEAAEVIDDTITESEANQETSEKLNCVEAKYAEDFNGVQDIPVSVEQTMVEVEPTVVEEIVEIPASVVVEESLESVEIIEESVEKLSTEDPA